MLNIEGSKYNTNIDADNGVIIFEVKEKKIWQERKLSQETGR